MEATHNLLTSHRCPWESGTGQPKTFGEDRVQSCQLDCIFWSFRVIAYSFSVCRTFRFCFYNFSYLILQFNSYCTSSYTSLMLCYIGKTSPACFFFPNSNERFHEVAYSFDCFLPAMTKDWYCFHMNTQTPNNGSVTGWTSAYSSVISFSPFVVSLRSADKSHSEALSFLLDSDRRQ